MKKSKRAKLPVIKGLIDAFKNAYNSMYSNADFSYEKIFSFVVFQTL
jgi:hypothetical protein